MMTVNGTEIGDCLYGTEVGIVDYSRKERQFDGSVVLIERGYTDYVSFKVRVPSDKVANVKSVLAANRANLGGVYTGQTADGANAGITQVVTVTGLLNSFTISIDSYEHSTLTLEVEGIVQVLGGGVDPEQQ
jgi:hypothetical protein